MYTAVMKSKIASVLFVPIRFSSLAVPPRVMVRSKIAEGGSYSEVGPLTIGVKLVRIDCSEEY